MSAIKKAVRNLGRTLLLAVFAISIVAVFTILNAEKATIAHAGTGQNLSGYAWSDTIGWISLNCTTTDTCATSDYGVNVNTTSGNFSGYAWSDNIGWISFSETAGCPEAECTTQPEFDKSTGAVTGWARACAGTLNGDCTGASRTDGWDGWIKLSGTAADGSAYGVTATSTALSGYSWGSDVVGWLSWSGDGYGVVSSVNLVPPSCTAGYFCTGNDLYQRDAACTETLSQHCSYSCSGNACIAPPPIAFTSFTANSNGSSQGTFTATGHIQARPSLLHSGDKSWIYWNVDNASSCTVIGSNGDSWSGISSGAYGATTTPIVGQTTYTLACDALEGASPPIETEVDTVNIIPVFQEL